MGITPEDIIPTTPDERWHEEVRANFKAVKAGANVIAAVAELEAAAASAARTVTNPTPEQDWQRAQALALVAIARLFLFHESIEH